jgi:poly(A) polymerase
MKLKEILHMLESIYQKMDLSPIYLCGGVVRDKVMNRTNEVEDLDLTSGDSSISELAREFSILINKKYKGDTKVNSDGHITIFLGNLKIDFSSNFNATNIEQILKDKGIAKPTSMQKEIFSRDFTCNALLIPLDLKNIIDPTKQGIRDINNKKIMTCLDPEITFTTNKNRVIRAIYLAAKLDFDIDDRIIDWVAKHPESINFATKKVLSDKISSALKFDADKTIYYITKMNLWKYIPITEALSPYYHKYLKESNVK